MVYKLHIIGDILRQGQKMQDDPNLLLSYLEVHPQKKKKKLFRSDYLWRVLNQKFRYISSIWIRLTSAAFAFLCAPLQ